MTDGSKPDDAAGARRPEPSAAGEDERLAERLRALDRRIRDREEAAKPAAEAGAQRDMRGFALAMRLSSEFVSGVIVGCGLGWGFDHFLGTSPWGLIVFTILGFGAGVYNMVRALGRIPGQR
jgi:ATP synthase protein I